jgi:hypothetical protein
MKGNKKFESAQLKKKIGFYAHVGH